MTDEPKEPVGQHGAGWRRHGRGKKAYVRPDGWAIERQQSEHGPRWYAFPPGQRIVPFQPLTWKMGGTELPRMWSTADAAAIWIDENFRPSRVELLKALAAELDWVDNAEEEG